MLFSSLKIILCRAGLERKKEKPFYLIVSFEKIYLTLFLICK